MKKNRPLKVTIHLKSNSDEMRSELLKNYDEIIKTIIARGRLPEKRTDEIKTAVKNIANKNER